ncbi:serine/threonine kinase 17a like [Polypterus senegalus]|uniref:serine/threonine kinase 17a like n=1 Tax=Polypterus senegalus TaxID=55291 RepID=UPI001964FB9B|nr:serine/threonine kinase 17a like [Polypterus senegalus]
MPESAVMHRNGMLSDIQTRIRTEPLNGSYEVAGKELGRGKFAVVKKCVDKTTGNEHAAKFLRKRRKGVDCRMDIINEVAILEMTKSNPYVVALHEVFETTSEIILVLEYAAGGEIFNQCVADNDEAFTEKDVIRLVRQILSGVAFLHRSNVVHLDLKPQNILLTSSRPLGDIRIVDFGLSRQVDNVKEVREILGTPEYVAPEILSYDPISTATDMWSIGVLTYVMLTGESPFLGDDKQETYLNISQVNVSYSQDVFEGVSNLAVDFIKSLLVKSPRARATAEDCLQHPWLTPHPDALTPLSESDAGQSDPESPDSAEELVLSYTICQSDLEVVRKSFTFEEPFSARPEIQQELVC